MKRVFNKYYKYLLAGYLVVGAIAALYWFNYRSAKQELVSYLASRYDYDDYIQVKRGPYGSCVGQIQALSKMQYVVYFDTCKGQKMFHAVVNADEFDDKAENFMQKF